MLACSYSSGDIVVFALAGELLFTIPKTLRTIPSDLSDSITGLVFIEHKHSSQWSAELLVINFSGTLNNYLVSATNGFQKNYSFSFANILPHGVCSVVYHPKHSLLIIGSLTSQGQRASADELCPASLYGLTTWRILSGFPHFNLIEDEGTALMKFGSGILNKLRSLPLLNPGNDRQDGVVYMSLSPDGTKLAALHLSGTLSLWQVPSLRCQRMWTKDEQPSVKNHEEHPVFPVSKPLDSNKDSSFFGLIDVNWWTEEALILSHSIGALTVSSVEKSLYNLLGSHPEMCEPWSRITAAHDKGFLILEFEGRDSKSESDEDDEEETTFMSRKEDGKSESDEDDDEETTFMSRTKHFTNQVLFFLTESERFQQPVKIRRVLQRTYRLVCLRSTTPEELYARKIELEEYGEALVLAQTYGLDSDLVYQKQWRKSPVSVASIHDYLSKVKNRLWVLNECVVRVPETYEAAKQLLLYGLHGTDVKVVKALGGEMGPLPFIIKTKKDEEGEDNNEKKEKKLKEVEEFLEFESFNLEQRGICMYRLKLLQYLDRLSTYEVILGGVHMAHEEYCHTFFERFRELNILQAAVEYAREGNWEALDVIFTYHGKETIPHRLAILSNFDETIPPFEYSTLLPEAGFPAEDPEILEWDEKSWRDVDWVENVKCKKIFGWDHSDNSTEFIYLENPDLQLYRCKLTSDVVTQWYRNRACEIEHRSQQVENSLQLIKLGMERRIKGLEDLQDDLVTLEVLIYESCADVYLNLESFQSMNELEKLRMLLKKSTEESFIVDFKSWVLPFLQRLRRRKKKSQVNLIHHYLTDIAKTDLTYVLKIFQNSTPEIKEPIIADVAEQMKLALVCIYITKRFDQLSLAFSILECLPSSSEDVLSDQIRELNKKVDQLEVHLCATETLAKHGLEKPVSFVLDTHNNSEETTSLMVNITEAAAKQSPPLKEAQWIGLLGDMLTLQKEVYTCIEPSVCYEIYTETLLHSGRQECIQLAGQMICKTAMEDDYPEPTNPVTGPRIKCSRGIELVLEASKEYFNSSADLTDKAMDLARDCLNLIEDRSAALQEEFDLIAALALLDDFGITILPLQVRLCEDKLTLIRQVLQSSTLAYKKKQKILHLASLLQISGSDEKLRYGRVLMLTAESAIQALHYSFACAICQNLMTTDYSSVWTICRILGECEEFKDLKARQSLLAFALTHCLPDELESLLKSRSLLETQILYQDLNQHMQVTDQGMESSSDQSLLTQSKSLLSAVGHNKFWKSTMKWIRPLQDDQMTLSNSELIKPTSQAINTHRFHPFYQSLVERNLTRMKEDKLPYEEHIAKQMANKPLLFSRCLLRTQKLSESRCEGEIVEPTDEVLIQLAESILEEDTTLGIGYLLALHEASEVNEFFSSFGNSYLCLHMAAYCFAVSTYSILQPSLSTHQADVYHHLPSDITDHVMSHITAGLHNNWPKKSQDFANFLVQYHNHMADFTQGQLLQSLGKGVDIGRFAQDPEYKRETILGLAMALEEEVFSTAMSLAERYDVSKWEMFMTHLESLFLDSNLSTKEIQERVNKLEIMNTLLQDPSKVLERMQENVYVTIDGTKQARLIYYYMLLEHCEEKDNTLKDKIDAQTHLRILKKIKSAAPGLDYKKLTTVDSPLQVLKPVLTEANFNLLAKLATKIPTKDGSSLESSSVYRVYVEKLFWEGEQKAKESEADQPVDWSQRYDICHKQLPRLSAQGIQQFVDSITFSELAVDTIPVENRVEIVNRALRFVRQQDAALKKKGISDTQDESGLGQNVSFGQVINHLEQSCRHLESLADPLIYELTEHDEEMGTSYARLFALSRSEPLEICELVSLMLIGGASLDMINELLLLASRQKPQTGRVGKAVQQTLKVVLESFSETTKSSHPWLGNKRPIDVLRTILQTVSMHVEKGGTMTNQEDVLECLRPFCADVAVPAAIKTEVLQLMEESFDLSGEDTFLLIFYQTDAIVSSTWNRKLILEDIDSDTKRHRLFEILLSESLSLSQLLCLGTLLQIWPVLAATELNEEPSANPWVQLMDKIIRCHGDGESVIDMLKQLCRTTSLTIECCSHVYNLMLLKCKTLYALKFALVSKMEAMHHLALENMKSLKANSNSYDDELLELIISLGLTADVAKTPFLTSLISYVTSHPDGPVDTEAVEETTELSHAGARVKLVASQLQAAGHWGEAGTLMLNYHGTHPALRTFDGALGALSRWLRR
ncbi:neuroblastoma-amplified sequence-like isoform X1 [Stylophora pistillata]|uniref:neuroblastoma-amplified sequence-like isoform X1 n=1 Tax=Stylophora pistillata TaxID=50429 RepID=UPI000C054A7E|nr:neuroblastoma-amplified sequence-like isoform X1 [Stylophora pistillata]